MLRLILAMLALNTLVGCDEFELSAPPGFVELESSAYAFQATNAQNVVIAVRTLDANGASHEFWQTAVREQMRRLGGYELVDERDVRSKDGTAGSQLSFHRQENGKRHVYTVATFVKEDSFAFVDRRRLFVVETGGEAAAYESQADTLTRTLASIEL